MQLVDLQKRSFCSHQLSPVKPLHNNQWQYNILMPLLCSPPTLGATSKKTAQLGVRGRDEAQMSRKPTGTSHRVGDKWKNKCVEVLRIYR